jgi:hypothetical protein
MYVVAMILSDCDDDYDDDDCFCYCYCYHHHCYCYRQIKKGSAPQYALLYLKTRCKCWGVTALKAVEDTLREQHYY